MRFDLDADSARSVVLRRIQASTGATTLAEAHAQWSAIERTYRIKATRPREAVLELLEDRLRDYDARVTRVSEVNVARNVATILIERKVQRMVLPAGLPAKWLPNGFALVVDEGLSATELDLIDGVMTEATVAIAETGTVVLQNVTGQGRRAITLVPDYHLCVVRIEEVVETVPEAVRRLQATAAVATTFISGPSATADIEMTRIKGVHGPRFLDVILVN
jgi:L-lactate dehydrogenase complex protein LldG